MLDRQRDDGVGLDAASRLAETGDSCREIFPLVLWARLRSRRSFPAHGWRRRQIRSAWLTPILSALWRSLRWRLCCSNVNGRSSSEWTPMVYSARTSTSSAALRFCLGQLVIFDERRGVLAIALALLGVAVDVIDQFLQLIEAHSRSNPIFRCSQVKHGFEDIRESRPCGRREIAGSFSGCHAPAVNKNPPAAPACLLCR